MLLQLSNKLVLFVMSSFVITARCVMPRGHGKAQLHFAQHLSCCHTSGISSMCRDPRNIVAKLTYRVPKRLEDSLIFKHVWNKRVFALCSLLQNICFLFTLSQVQWCCCNFLACVYKCVRTSACVCVYVRACVCMSVCICACVRVYEWVGMCV